MNNNEMIVKELMPINESFIDVFDTFMDENQKNKIRANSVRQYVEGIIDLLLKDKISATLKPNELYEGVNWGRKIKIIKEYYDLEIGEKIQNIFKIGGDGSHFSGQVHDDELQEIIKNVIHIVEDIFVKYFLDSQHIFGTENIYTIFSMLPLHHRIYILEKITDHYTNPHVVDRLSLAYAKSGDVKKAVNLLAKSLGNKVINQEFYIHQINKLRLLCPNIDELYERNKNYEENPEFAVGLIVEDQIVVGLPTSKDIFDTARAVTLFKYWFESGRDKYPEFINLFLYLMQTDNREYN